MKFNSIVAALDMAGCPNRCRHCWLGATENRKMDFGELRYVGDSFRPFTDNLILNGWYREPDFRDDYKELWKEEIRRSWSDTGAVFK